MFKWARTRGTRFDAAASPGDSDLDGSGGVDRRGMLRYGGLAAAGAAGAAIANAVGASPASADTGDPLIMGVDTNVVHERTIMQVELNGCSREAVGLVVVEGFNEAAPLPWQGNYPTIFVSASNCFDTALQARGYGQADGIITQSDGRNGLVARSNTGTGVNASGSTAVNAQGRIGVYAQGQGDTGIGVQATATFGGRAIVASAAGSQPTAVFTADGKGGAVNATTAATAAAPVVKAISGSIQPAIKAVGRVVPAGGPVSTPGNNTALDVEGVVTFSRSGVASVTGNPANSIVVNIAGHVTSHTAVLATIQGVVAHGLSVQSVQTNGTNGTATIYFTAPAPVGTKVAWFALS
jgi:hypothetical protein